MATEPTPTPAPTPEATPAPAPTPAAAAPSLLGAPGPAAVEMPAAFAGGADAWAKLDDAGKTAAVTAASDTAKAESAARVDGFTKAEGKDAKLAAYAALTADEKAAAFKALPEASRKELGIEDPAIPVYDIAKFKAPEGMTLDPEAIKPALELFKETRLPQEQAQKFLDLALGREKAAAEAGVRAYVDLQNKWTSEIKADPEIGGAKLDQSIAAAARVIDRLNVPGLREALNLTGAGNHPAVVKAFARLGQMMTEDRFAPGKHAEPSAPISTAERLYGASGPKQSADA